MSKLVVSANSYDHLLELIKMDIVDGIIISINDLSVNSSYYMDVDLVKKTNFLDKEVFISLNKNMHNFDLELLRNVINEIKDMDIKILFYDMAVYRIAREYNIVNKLVIYQDHLNTSILSNKFYNDLGINGSYISSDITKDELLDIKKNTNMEIMFCGYGYVPIFYSRRYLISNYLEYIQEDEGNDYKIISDTGIEHPIEEEKYGSTVYTEKPINLINYLKDIDIVDYIVMNSRMIDNNEFNEMIKKFRRKDNMDDCYIGFFNTKTIYKVK